MPPTKGSGVRLGGKASRKRTGQTFSTLAANMKGRDSRNSVQKQPIPVWQKSLSEFVDLKKKNSKAVGTVTSPEAENKDGDERTEFDEECSTSGNPAESGQGNGSGLVESPNETSKDASDLSEIESPSFERNEDHNSDED